MAIITFSDIYNGAINRAAESTSDSTLVGYVKDWINYRYKGICSIGRWPFLQDTYQPIRMLAEYETGTVSCSVGGTSVTGSSTVWTKAMTDRKFKFTDFDEIYRLAQWSSATGIVLNTNYNGTSAISGGEYKIFQDEYLCPFTWKEIKNLYDSRNGKKIDYIQLREFRSKYPNNYANDTDPTQYTIIKTRDVTRIDTDAQVGTFVEDEIVDGGTSNAYGYIKKVGTDYLYIQILYGTFTDGETLTGATSAATTTVDESSGYTEGNIGGTLRIQFNNPPYRNILYYADIIKKVVDLSDDTDEPYIPEEFRDMLHAFAVSDIHDYRKRKDDTAKWLAEANTRLLQMFNKYRHVMGNPKIMPNLQRVKYL